MRAALVISRLMDRDGYALTQGVHSVLYGESRECVGVATLWSYGAVCVLICGDSLRRASPI